MDFFGIFPYDLQKKKIKKIENEQVTTLQFFNRHPVYYNKSVYTSINVFIYFS